MATTDHLIGKILEDILQKRLSIPGTPQQDTTTTIGMTRLPPITRKQQQYRHRQPQNISAIKCHNLAAFATVPMTRKIYAVTPISQEVVMVR